MARILFVQQNEWQQLGILYLSGNLKKHGHLCELALGSDYSEFSNRVAAFKPDLIGFSIMTGGHHWALEVAQYLKGINPELKTIFGGPHCTFFPEFIEREGVDFIVRGEGEDACLELMNCIQDGTDYSKVLSLWLKTENGEIIKNEMSDLGEIDDVSFPDRELYKPYSNVIDMSVLNVLTSRGCPYKCTFCFEPTQQEIYKGKGKYVRLRTHENVLEELKEIISSNVNFDSIMFVDDIFGMNRNWLFGFLKKYKEQIALPFSCLIRTEIICNHAEEFAFELAAAGCTSVACGIETGSEEMRSLILQKRLTNAKIERVAKAFHDNKIGMKTYNIFGIPGETVEQSFETVELNIKIKADYPLSNLFIPFPKTRLTEYSIEHGFLHKDYNADSIRHDGFIHSQLIHNPNLKVQQRINKVFQTAVLFPVFWPMLKKYCLIKKDIWLLDKFVESWFGMVYFLVYLKSSNRDPFKMFRYGLKNYREMLGWQTKKNKKGFTLGAFNGEKQPLRS